MKKITLTLLLLCSASLFASIATVTTRDLQQIIATDSRLVIIDARAPEYYTGEMIPGAIWIPYDAPEEKITAAIPSKSTPVVLYCFSATCPASGRLADRLEKMGYTNIAEYKNGLKEWKASGLPTSN